MSTDSIDHPDLPSLLTPDQVDCYERDGFVVIERFFNDAELNTIQAGVWRQFPSGPEYMANPEQFAQFVAHAQAALSKYPWQELDANMLPLHPRLHDVARQLIGSDDIRLYKAELWAKYGGGPNYEQEHHRDFGNHTLAVPSRDRRWRQLTTYVYLVDVDETNGATAIVPKHLTDHIPLGIRKVEPASEIAQHLRAHELRLCAPAGSLVLYSTEVFHRATSFDDPHGSRFLALIDFRGADATWTNKQSYGDRGLAPEMSAVVVAATPRQRGVLDIPLPGHPYWTEQTISDMIIRYPDIDMHPYREAAATVLP